MRLPAIAAAVLVSALAGRAALAAPDGCGVCHGKERVLFEASVHRGGDVGCTTCHGGDPAAVDSKDAAHSAAKGYRGKLARPDVAAACGTCHADIARMRPFGLRTDALAAYRTSHHGEAMAKGKTDAATCSDCHGVHDVVRTKDARSPAYRVNVPQTCGRCHGDAAMMERHGVRGSTAVADYSASVHGVRLARGEPGVPSCADCHDAHAAAPPGATEVADVCGSCHAETRDRFRESPHFAASERGMMHQCVTCHGNHAVAHPDFALFDAKEDPKAAGGSGTRCLTCHEKESDRGHAAAVAFGAGLRQAEAALRDAALRVDALQAQGFHVDDERDALDRARRELVHTVPLSHTVDVPQVQGSLRRAQSLVDEALDGCGKKTIEVRDRRIFGSAAAFLLLVASGFLVLRRRRAAR